MAPGIWDRRGSRRDKILNSFLASMFDCSVKFDQNGKRIIAKIFG